MSRAKQKKKQRHSSPYKSELIDTEEWVNLYKISYTYDKG